MTRTSGPGISVVVVAYGHAEDLARCLDPLTDRYPLLVIDNSADAECRRVVEASSATYVAPGDNLGFAAGVNHALDLLAGRDDHVLLLNPDAVIRADDVTRLAACLADPGNGSVAAVSPVLRCASGEHQQVAWPFPSPVGTWADALGLGRFAPRWSFLAGSVLLLRNGAIRDVGRFDERFFLYAEEADWQWRAHLRGWTVEVCREAAAFHAGGGTSADPVVREALFHASAEALLRKWYGPAGWTSARVATIVGAILRAACRRGVERTRALDRARLYVRGPRRAATALGLR